MECSKPRFYVYFLCHPDGVPFYIGKGQGNRIVHHEKEARTGCECSKCQMIRTLWAQGDQVRYQIVLETDNEHAALAYERDLIRQYGLVNLTNQTEGGRGLRGYRFNPEQLHKRTYTRKQRYLTADFLQLLKAAKYSVRAFCQTYSFMPTTIYASMQQRQSLNRNTAWRLALAYAEIAGLDDATAYQRIIMSDMETC